MINNVFIALINNFKLCKMLFFRLLRDNKMLGFLTDLFKKSELPENEFSQEEKDYYLKLVVALSEGDFKTLDDVFRHDDADTNRLLTIRFEKFMDDIAKLLPASEVQKALENQIPLGTFCSRMVKY